MGAHERSDEEYLALMRARASVITALVTRDPLRARAIAARAKSMAKAVEHRNDRFGVMYEPLSLLNASSHLFEIYWEIEREIVRQYPPF
jgi:hypothetical protein